MKILVVLGVIVFLIASADAGFKHKRNWRRSDQPPFRCWTCENQPSLEACNEFGKLQTCRRNQHACETHVRRNGNDLVYFRQCKERHACNNNQQQNTFGLSVRQECNDDAQTSVCRCCCFTDNCGRFTDDCSELDEVEIAMP